MFVFGFLDSLKKNFADQSRPVDGARKLGPESTCLQAGVADGAATSFGESVIGVGNET